jgi:CPA2 family monovalent cation:H+ antiporter-2
VVLTSRDYTRAVATDGRDSAGGYHRPVEVSAPGILDVGVVLLLAAGAGWLARALNLPAVVGYLAVGLAISPFTPGYVADRTQLAFLADIGVALLLFEVGIEIDIARLRREHGAITWAAPLQVVVTAGVSMLILTTAGVPAVGAALVALGIGMSSSVVIVNITRSRRRTTDRATEEAMLGWSVVQDLTGVTLAVVLLAVAGAEDRPLPLALAGGAAFAAIAVAAALALPRILRQLEGDGDLFLIVSVAVGLAVAGLGAVLAGIPVALAAFVGGLAIVEGPEAAEVRRRLLPFRDLLAVLFFVVLGSLIDPAALARGFPWLVLIVGLVIAAKSGVAALLARASGLPANAVQLGIGLGQVGEFSFVLASVGVALDVVAAELYAAVLGAVVVTIVGSTIVVRLAGKRTTSTAAPAKGS